MRSMSLSTVAHVSHDTKSPGRDDGNRVARPAPRKLVISPELALVDPELAAIARAQLPDVPPAVRAARPDPVHAEATEAAPSVPVATQVGAEPVPAPERATAGRAPAPPPAALPPPLLLLIPPAPSLP